MIPKFETICLDSDKKINLFDPDLCLFILKPALQNVQSFLFYFIHQA